MQPKGVLQCADHAFAAVARNAEGPVHRPFPAPPARTNPACRIVERQYPAFTACPAAQGRGLPACVQRKVEDYFGCGRLEHGFLRVNREFPVKVIASIEDTAVIGKVLVHLWEADPGSEVLRLPEPRACPTGGVAVPGQGRRCRRITARAPAESVSA